MNERKKVSISGRLKALKVKLSFANTKQPAKLKKMRTVIIVRTIVFDFLFSIFAFSLKWAQMAFQHEMTMLALLFAGIYFAERTIRTAYQTYAEYCEDNFKQIYTSYITDLIMDIANKARGKVFKKNSDGIQTIMEHPELIKKTKDYVTGIWNFWWVLPIVISRSITLAILCVMTGVVEMKSGTAVGTGFFMFLLLLCIVAYFYFGKERIKVMNSYRKQRKENESREEVLFAELKTIEFASENDFLYHATRLRKQMIKSIQLLTDERLNMNRVFVKRSGIASGFMLVILAYKFFANGSVNEAIFLDIVAISSVYSTILEKISDILYNFEDLWNYIIEVDTIYPDFSKIDEVFWDEKAKSQKRIESTKLNYTETCSIQVSDFIFSYDERNTWRLINPEKFDLNLGEVTLVRGETGCGKTTWLNILNGNVRMPETPIHFSNGEIGWLNTLTYHTDRAMANNFLLNEIILDDDLDTVDKKKLFEIMEGLKLKELFMTFAKHDESLTGIDDSEELLLGFMKSRTYNQFSSGQKQRIALAKLLYTLDDSVQAILLDEAFNRLNDEIAEECVEFILEYVQRDRKRMVLLATHQLNIIRKYCSKEISFELNEDGSSSIKVNKL